jgi:hypothetical protein
MKRSGGSHRVYGVALALCLSLYLPIARAEPPTSQSLPSPGPVDARGSAREQSEDADVPPLLSRTAAPARPVSDNPMALRFFSRDIATFHAPFLGISPAERARLAERRLVELIERGGPGQVLVRDSARVALKSP